MIGGVAWSPLGGIVDKRNLTRVVRLVKLKSDAMSLDPILLKLIQKQKDLPYSRLSPVVLGAGNWF